MDGRESTVASGPNFSSFYAQHRGIGGPGVAGHSAGLHSPPPGGYRQHLDAVSAGYGFQTPQVGGPHIGQGYHHVEASPPVAQHSAGGGAGAGGSMDIGMGVAVGADAKGDQGSGAGQDEHVKKKRGRPRKYKPDGAVTLGLSPSSSSTPHSSSSGMAMVTTPGSGFGSGGSGSGAPSEKRGRGRPPGSGKMQQLASLGKWFLGSVGTGFTPHVIIISPGEDIAARIMAFSQQGPRAVCIISATGAVSTATLHQDSESGGVVTYEGRFEILCLSGSYLVLDDGGIRTRSGGLCIALCGPDHRVIGGSVGGVLRAAGTVQVIVGSFMYGGSKKNKAKAEAEADTGHEEPNAGEEEAPAMALPEHNMPPHPMSGWAPSMMRQMDSRSSNIDINSIRE
ncbi:AT-hook motif nuclear-localized protein 9-like [Phragmites australis]|uniref:AT-hook motif nuclear-localized protein 9-like n=1 Tax=Phragmites australis TaxID=29695 RepID=UPI002D79F684|nr:AT-hook motif nuclear-localized protein 9-like [Phragmites australis]